MTKYVIKRGAEFFVVVAKGFVPKDTIGILPSGIPKSDWSYITASEDSPGVWSISVDAAKKAAGDSEEQKEVALENAKTAKRDAIQNKVEEVFPQVDAGELVLKAEVWRHMSKDASKFKDLGLKVVEQVNNADNSELFSPGSALDNPAKIKSYADRKLELYEDFLAAMALAEQVHENEKETILGS